MIAAAFDPVAAGFIAFMVAILFTPLWVWPFLPKPDRGEDAEVIELRPHRSDQSRPYDWQQDGI